MVYISLTLLLSSTATDRYLRRHFGGPHLLGSLSLK